MAGTGTIRTTRTKVPTRRTRRRGPLPPHASALLLLLVAASLSPALLTIAALSAASALLAHGAPGALARWALAVAAHPWASALTAAALPFALAQVLRARRDRGWVWLRRLGRLLCRGRQGPPADSPAGDEAGPEEFHEPRPPPVLEGAGPSR